MSQLWRRISGTATISQWAPRVIGPTTSSRSCALPSRAMAWPCRLVSMPIADGAALAWLHEHGEVLATRPSEAEMQVDVRLSDSGLARFLKRDR